MYLDQLDNDKKVQFLQLCIHASMADKVLSDEEKKTIDAYSKEMGIQPIHPNDINSLDDVLNELKQKCNARDLNIILIEIIALLMSDKKYDLLEIDFMKHFQSKMNITDSKIEDALFAIKHLSEAYAMLNEVLEN